MRPLNPSDDDTIRPEVRRERAAYGISYGAAAGLAFAAVTWGGDAYLLQQANALFPWLKLFIGLLMCGAVGGAAGWLVMQFDRTWAALPIWLAAAAWFAWLVTALPLQMAPTISSWLVPELRPLMGHPDLTDLSARFGLAFVWVAIFSAITGILQLPLSDSGVFSTSWLGKTAPALVCIFIMGISGTIADSLNNQPLRSGLLAVDETIQFAVDHQGQTVDQKAVLRMHLGALRLIKEHIDKPRKLTIGGFDQFLGEVSVLVRFGDVWATCISIYNQPSNCKIVGP